ncbi:MAG: DUF2142 domain-containing protein [Conexibacter sp.]
MTAAHRPELASRAGRARGSLERWRAHVRAFPRPLALLLAAAATLSLAWAIVLPPFQGPDESEHFAYVQHLAETGSAPSPTTFSGAGSHSTEQREAMDTLGLRALMANPSARPSWSAADQDPWRRFEASLPDAARKDGDGLNPIGKNPPLYYAYEAVAYRASPSHSLWGRLLAARLANGLLFLATVAFAWLAASELTRRTWARTLAAGLVALQPQLISLSAIVNADTLLTAVWTAFLALAIRTLVRGPTARRVVGLFALAAASALTHGRGIALLPPLAVVLAAAAWRHRPPLREALRWSGAGVAILAVALVAFRLFTTAGGSGGTLYGGQTNYIHQGGFDLKQLASLVWQFYLPPLPSMQPPLGGSYGYRQLYIETFFGAFGWLEVRYPQRIYTLIQLAAAGGLIALYTAVVVRARELWAQRHVAIGVAAIALSLIALLHLVSYLSLLGSADPLIVGRYLMPLVGVFALAVTFVATSLPRRLGPLLAAVLLGAAVALDLGGLGMVVIRFYG